MEVIDSRVFNVHEQPPTDDLLPIEGTFRKISSDNYDVYLKGLGVSPMMSTMIAKADEMVTIFRDLDQQWKIKSETSIKAKSVRGYQTRNYKMVENKFIAGKSKEELLDDWDPRSVVSTVTLEGNELVLRQDADKTKKCHKNNIIRWTAKGDELTMRGETEDGIVGSKIYKRESDSQKEKLH